MCRILANQILWLIVLIANQRCSQNLAAVSTNLFTRVCIRSNFSSIAVRENMRTAEIGPDLRFLQIMCLTNFTRVWARPRHCANPALQLELSLSKTAKGTICPLQNLGKKLKRKHTRRDLFQYRNCKLKQNVESIFYRTLKGLLILRAVAEPRNLQKHEKYGEIW